MSKLIPTCDDFTGSKVVDHYDDMVNPPGLTNHWAVAQVDHDITAVRSVNIPPVSSGDCVTGRLYLGGTFVQSRGIPVTHQWRPDRVTRTMSVDQWDMSTETVCPPGKPGVVVIINVTNTSSQAEELDLGLWVNSEAVKSVPWLRGEPPRGYNTLAKEGAKRRGTPAEPPVGMAFDSALPPGANVQALQGLVYLDGTEVTDVSESDRFIQVKDTVEPSGTWQGAFIVTIADEGEDIDKIYGELAASVSTALEDSEKQWNADLAGLFEGNDYTLPILETSNDALRTLYWWGAMGTLWFRRENPHGIRPRHYDTLMPRYWQTTTFMWDYSLSSIFHALADPQEMREQIIHWVGLDINEHFGTEWLTGGPVGNWYSVNQYALIRLVRDYISFTGDTDFLNEQVSDVKGRNQTIGDHVRTWATEWKDKRGSSPLADYGKIDNLLECVSSYVHEVASLNAANVWCMRVAAELSDIEGKTSEAAQLRADADDLLPEVLKLYRQGEGFFNVRMPDGTEHGVGHCYDYSTIGTVIDQDLPESMKTEMLAFFDEQLRTETWMRALSAHDENAGFSVRPDHQWNGAYPAWPADSARATIKLGGAHIVADWIQGLARTANQGPPGQAHLVPEYHPETDGGSTKAPPQFPYLIDWSCSSAGSWCELVIEAIFGLEYGPHGEPQAHPHLDHFDPEARLLNIRIGKETYNITRSGIETN